MKVCFYLLLISTACFISSTNGQKELKGKKLTVVSSLHTPYLMASDSSDDGKMFKGFVVDVLDELAKLLGFEYEIKTNSRNGQLDPDTNKWMGMIGDVIDGKADLAFSDLTMTPERIEVVEFAYPFLSFDLGVMHHESATEDRHQTFGIFSPFSTHIWAYIIIMCCVYFVVLFLIGRISHKDWRMDNIKRSYKSELGLWNSFWFMASSFFLRTTHTTPRGVATRLLSISFYFFSLLVVILYISNFTAFKISSENAPQDSKFTYVEKLLQDENKQFAAIGEGSTHGFLKKSEISHHQDIYEAIPESNYFESYTEAEKALKDNPNLVLVLEYPQMEYITNRQCSFKGAKISGTKRSFGIALPLGSPYRSMISKSLIEMEFYGKISLIYHKWWVQKSGGTCSNDQKTSSGHLHHTHELSISNIRNICMFFGIAVVVSIVIALLEFGVRSALTVRGRKGNSYGNVLGGLKLMCTCRDRYVESAALPENETINVDTV